MTADAGADMAMQTEAAYRRAVLLTDLAKVAKGYWLETGDTRGLELAAGFSDESAAIFEQLIVMPGEEDFVRALAKVDRAIATHHRATLAAFGDTPPAFRAAADPAAIRSLASRERTIREVLRWLTPESSR
jgi:hypothetical protein